MNWVKVKTISQNTRGRAGNHLVWPHVLGDNTIGTDNRALSDMDPCLNKNIAPDPYIVVQYYGLRSPGRPIIEANVGGRGDVVRAGGCEQAFGN
jgi:hypothetical protein